MSEKDSFQSYLLERWFAQSQDASRAEAILESILELETSKYQLPTYLQLTIRRFLADRAGRRKAAEARLEAMEAKREAMEAKREVERKGGEG